MLAVGAAAGAVVTRGPGPGRRGVNAAGADFGVGSRFDTDASFAFYASRGHELVRLPFLWESVQPRPGEDLDEAYLEQLRQAVASCTRREMVCILDVHSYARHGEAVIGDGDLTGEHLADLWVRLAGTFDDAELVELGLMNEPHDLPGGARTWEDAVSTTVTALRRSGSEHFVWVAGEQWSSAASWADTHPEWWVEDPLGRSGPEGHYYFDAANLRRGTYPARYEEDEAAAEADGFSGLRDKVTTELGGFTEYCRRNGLRGLLGEIGWPNDTPAAAFPEDSDRWDAIGDAAYGLLDRAGLDVTVWAAGEQWGDDYNLSVYTGTPQTTATSVAAVVEAHGT